MELTRQVEQCLMQAQAYLSKSDYPNAEKRYLEALEKAAETAEETQLIHRALKELTAFYSQLDQYDDAIAQGLMDNRDS